MKYYDKLHCGLLQTIGFYTFRIIIIVCLLADNITIEFAPELVSNLAPRDLHRRAAYSICESSFLIHHGGYHDLFICL